MKKFFVLSILVLSIMFFVSCGNSNSGKPEVSDKEGNRTDADQTDDADAGKTDAEQQNDSDDSDADSVVPADDSDSNDSETEDIDPEFVADENLFEIPANQDNTEGAPCDFQTFVEFCDGNAYIYCSPEEEYNEKGEIEEKYFVERYECDEDAPVCFTYRRNDEGWEHNWANCFSYCETIGKEPECASDDGFDFWYFESTCKQTSKGKLMFEGEAVPCNSVCSEDGKTCEIEECDPETYEATCDENGVLHWCWEYHGHVAAAFCGTHEEVCRYNDELDGKADCYPDDGNNE